MDCLSFVEAVVRNVGRRLAAAVCVAVLIAYCAALTRPAAAGVVVTQAHGKIELGPSGGLGETNSREFTATIPGKQTVDYNGQFGGIGQVSYDVAPTADQGQGQGLAANLTTSVRSTSSVGGPPVDGSSTFTLSFTSSLPIDFRFTAHLLRQGPQAFSAKLEGIVADARYNSLGEASGTIPHDENGIFGEFVQEGRLPAGAHTFTIESFATEIRSGAGATSGAASIRVTPIPLPPGAWTGLSVMSAMAIAMSLHSWRRRAAHS